MWEAQNQVVAMLQSAPMSAQAWLDAGNVSAHIAVILDSRDEGEYYMDAVLLLAHALQLDPNIKPKLDSYLDDLLHRLKHTNNFKDQCEYAQKWVKMVKSWKEPSFEITQFIHQELNGPGKCKRMCSASLAPRFGHLRILPVFGARVVTLRLGDHGTEEERLLKAAVPLLEADGATAVKAWALTEQPGQWQRNRKVSLGAVICDSAAEVWFADPRGAWPERWSGCISENGNPLLGAEPKAPFHWHSVMQCEKGEVVLFPGWLTHRLAPLEAGEVGAKARSFGIAAADKAAAKAGGPSAGWRLPRPQLLCADAVGRDVSSSTMVGVGIQSRAEL